MCILNITQVGANKDLISSQYSSSESTHQDTSKDAVNEDVVEPEAHNVLAVSTENKHMNEKYREPGQDNDDLLEDTGKSVLYHISILTHITYIVRIIIFDILFVLVFFNFMFAKTLNLICILGKNISRN